MEKVKKLVVDLIKSEVQNLPSKVVKNDSVLKKIPFNLVAKTGLMSEGEYAQIASCIAEFGLDDPKKLIKWFVDLHFAGIESINDGIASIRSDLLTSEVKKIEAMTDKLENITSNEKGFSLFKNYADQMIDVISQLEGKINNYISEIRRIDNLPRYKFFLQANFNKSKVTSCVQMTKSALQAYFEALEIYAVLANERNNDAKKYLEKKRSFVEGLDDSLLLAYDKDKSSFWDKNNMLQKGSNAKSLSDNLNKYLEAVKETEVDFEKDIKY